MKPEEQIISLSFMFKLILQKKILFVSIVIGVLLASVALALLLPRIYISQVLLIPNATIEENTSGTTGQGIASLLGGGTMQQDTRTKIAIATLSSKKFSRDFIKKYNLMPLLYPKDWGIDGNDLSQFDRIRLSQEAIEQLREIRIIEIDDEMGVVSIKVEWESAKIAKLWVENFASEINRIMQADAIERSQRNIDFLNEKLGDAKIPEIRNSLTNLIQENMRELMLANNGDEYAFHILDPAVEAALPSKPKRMIIVLVGGVLGFFLAVFILYLRFLYKKPE